MLNKKICIDDLPKVRGKYLADYPMSKLSWFRVGGNANIVYTPSDYDDLAYFLKNISPDIKTITVGAGSNTLFRDGGFAGVVIRPNFKSLTISKNKICAEAGVADAHVARLAMEHGIGGLEFFWGIPGSIGGAVAMNAGCYGRECKDVFVRGVFLDRLGNKITMNLNDMCFGYRSSPKTKDLILLSAEFFGSKANPIEIKKNMEKIQLERRQSQPIGSKTCGSTFKNPPGSSAWRLIQQAKCSDARVGGAMISPQHSNFIVNDGTATAQNIEDLISMIRKNVFDACGIMIEPEIMIIGEKYLNNAT